MNTAVLRDILQYSTHTSTFLCFLLAHTVLAFIQGIYKTVCSTTGNQFWKSTKIRRILWRKKWTVVHVASPRDFLTWHTSVIQPEYVLRPNVTLYCISKTEAIFVETPDGLDIFSSDVSLFLYNAQFQYCQRIITMPIAIFHSIAEKIGDPAAPVVWLSNIGRCGSTIIGQMFGLVKGTVLISENDSLTNLAFMESKGETAQNEYDKLLTSSIQMICKAHPDTTRFCIKPRNCGIVHMEPVIRLFPQIKQIFIYRNCLETISSMLDFSVSDTAKKLLTYCADSEFISRFVPLFRVYIYNLFALKNKDVHKRPVDMNATEIATFMWTCFIVQANTLKSNRNIEFVKYEQLICDPHETCRRMFEFTNIDVSEVRSAMCALEKDSQRGTTLHKRSTGKDPWRHINLSNTIKANAILSKYNLPRLGEDFNI